MKKQIEKFDVQIFTNKSIIHPIISIQLHFCSFYVEMDVWNCSGHGISVTFNFIQGFPDVFNAFDEFPDCVLQIPIKLKVFVQISLVFSYQSPDQRTLCCICKLVYTLLFCRVCIWMKCWPIFKETFVFTTLSPQMATFVLSEFVIVYKNHSQ